MHYVRILIALPCLRVTFCCIILEKAVIRVQIRSCILLSLMYSWCCQRYVLHTHHTPFARYTNTHMLGEHQVAKHQLPLLLPAPLPPLSPPLPSSPLSHIGESTRLVVEYKSKLQIAEAENQRLDGTVQRLEHQIKRLKGQIENLVRKRGRCLHV